jgi:hypothetical protein
VKQVYLLTYPTGKIYIGKDSIGSSRYMGSPDPSLVNADFATLSDEMRRNYTIRKHILWESETATEAELSAKEVEMIRARDRQFNRTKCQRIKLSRVDATERTGRWDGCAPLWGCFSAVRGRRAPAAVRAGCA